MKSNREWFKLLTDKEQEEFKRNCDEARFNTYMDSMSTDIMDFVDGAFNHFDSNEGYEYWGDIAESNRELKTKENDK